MLNEDLKKRIVDGILPLVQTPGQYIGGEWNAVCKDHRSVDGTLCLAFPDAYSIGMSHHGLQVLYAVMNRRNWACERVFTPLADMEDLLRRHGLPLCSLESFTPLGQFDVLGFSLQYDLSLRQRADDARSGRHPLGGRSTGPWIIRWSSPADRVCSTRNRWPVLSTCSSSATAKKPARRVRRVAAAETFRQPTANRCSWKWPGSFLSSMCRDFIARNSIVKAEPCRAADAAVARADPAGCRRSEFIPAARRPGGSARGMRPGADRGGNHARLSGQVPLLPEHHDQTPACSPCGNHSPSGLGAYRNTGYNEVSLLSLSRAIIRNSMSLCGGCKMFYGRWAWAYRCPA